MLVLTRHAKQSIMIGDEVVVTVLEVRGDQVRLGITAPRHVTVHREEIYVTAQRRAAEGAPLVIDLDAAAPSLTDLTPDLAPDMAPAGASPHRP